MASRAVQHEPDPATLVAWHRALSEHADGVKSFAARTLGDSTAAEDVTKSSSMCT